ncbi:helix-turn-helix domain-containing protein [Actinomadura welshii]
MTSMKELADAADSADPATGLAAVAALRRLADELEALHVGNARAQGWSWQAIAASLGVRRQSVHKKHAARLSGGRR